MAILIRLGDAADVDAAVSVYERSNLARRQSVWPNRAARVERVMAHLRDPASWFLLANEGPALVGMASAEALRGEEGAGPVIASAGNPMAYVQLRAGHSQAAITERYIHAAQVHFPGAAARGETRLFANLDRS